MQELAGQEARTLVLTANPASWPSLPDNVIAVERYGFFNASSPAASSLLDSSRDECPQSGMLPVVLDVLLALVHQWSGSWGSPPDVRAVLDAERRRVLSGVCLTFSRVISGEQAPSAHPLWRMAERFGATCREGVADGVTHVVAVAEETDKVQWAYTNRRAVVLPAWYVRRKCACDTRCPHRVECSCTLWQRANEEGFALRSLGARMAA